MQEISHKYIKNTLLELASIPSLSNTEGERKIEQKLVEKLEEITESANIFRRKLPADSLEREVIAGLVAGEGPAAARSKNNKTVILLNHHDVVDVLDYGQNRDLAFSPEKLTAKLTEENKTAGTNTDKNYLFGRGVADMKAGIAIQLAVMKAFTSSDLTGNLLFVSVPDEETSSRGMLTAVELITKLREQYQLDLQGVINCEPTFPAFPGDQGNYIYTGSMGKSVVLFYCRGVETHVGDVLSGLNANLLLAEVIRELEGNLKFCDSVSAFTAPPPTCLKARDNKRYYSAQIPHTAGGYFNINLLTSSPNEIMQQMKKLAGRALDSVLEKLIERKAEYLQKQNLSADSIQKPASWVLTYDEFLQEAQENNAKQVEKAIETLITEKDDSIEAQELCLQIMDRINDFVDRPGVGIVTGFTPPYYPPVTSDSDNKSDEQFNKLAQKLAEKAVKSGYQVDVFPVFPGISDLSYCRLESDLNSYTETLASNLPLWNQGYTLPLRQIAELDLAVLNISVDGRDAHKHTERLELNYSLKVVPGLVKEACQEILSS